MRCPKCKFISADKRDLCPKCLLDLRPEKKRLGLPITRPKVPYEELLELAKSKKTKTKKNNPNTQVADKPSAKSEKITKKPIWSELLSKFSLSKGKKNPVIKETVSTLESKPEEISQISSTTELLQPVEEDTVGLDKKAFEALFSELPGEPSDEDFSKIGEEMSLKLAQALSSTELLRELPTTNYASQISQATPEVVEFDEDDDALLEEQLDQILGDDIVEISSVKVPKKTNPVPQNNSIQVDDLEISFEFDMGQEEEEEEEVSSQATTINETQEATRFESKSINQLEAALRTLDAEFEASESLLDSSPEEEEGIELDTLESLKNDFLGLEDNHDPDIEEVDNFDLSLLKESIPADLKQSPDKLSDYLLQVLADTVGCKPEDLFNKQSNKEIVELEPEISDLDKEIETCALVELLDEPQIDEIKVENIQVEPNTPTIEIEEPQSLQITEPTLWDLAETELANIETEGEELELNQLVSKNNREELLVLFDAALLALEDSKLEAAYKTKVKLSENKQIEAEDLEIVFEKFGDSAAEDHRRGLSQKKSSSSVAHEKAIEPIEFAPIPIVSLSKLAVLRLTVSSMVVGLLLGALHLWMFDLIESSREAIISHQLFWFVLPHLTKNLGAAILLTSVILFYRIKTSD